MTMTLAMSPIVIRYVNDYDINYVNLTQLMSQSLTQVCKSTLLMYQSHVSITVIPLLLLYILPSGLSFKESFHLNTR